MCSDELFEEQLVSKVQEYPALYDVTSKVKKMSH